MKQSIPDASTNGDQPVEARSGIEGFVRKRFLIGVAFGVLFTAIFIAANDGSRVLSSLHIFDWRLVPLILALSLCNYLLRFAKWHFYLGTAGAGEIRKTTSFVIFFAGLAMAITPGKVGELLKPYLVRRVNGTPLTTTTPVIVAERITDGIAILILAAVGLLQIRYGWALLVALLVVFVVFMSIIQRRSLMEALLHRFGRFSLFGRRMEAIERLYDSTWRMFRPRPLAFATLISVVSWAGECLAMFLVLLGLGFPARWHLLFAAASALALATMIGALSLLPGGLGAAELSATGLLVLFVGSDQINHETAATATLLIRFATFWFGIALGLIALASSDWYLNKFEARSINRQK